MANVTSTISGIIEETWARLEREATARGIGEHQISNMKMAYAAALYGASAAMTIERAGAQELSEAAFRIESRK